MTPDEKVRLKNRTCRMWFFRATPLYKRRGVVRGAARTLSGRSGAGGAADIGRARTAGWSALENSSTFANQE